MFSFLSILSWAFRWAWFKPKIVERKLREQGLNGNNYKMFVGDVGEMTKMDDKAKTRPISLGDDIVPRVIPFIHQTINSHGMLYKVFDI